MFTCGQDGAEVVSFEDTFLGWLRVIRLLFYAGFGELQDVFEIMDETSKRRWMTMTGLVVYIVVMAVMLLVPGGV